MVGIALPHYARLMVSFHDNLGKPVPECLTIVGFSAARDHGVGDGGDNWNFATSADHLHLVPVKSPPSAAQKEHLKGYVKEPNISI